MGLLTHDDEWPAWAKTYERVRWLALGLVLAGFGGFYLATGNTLGRFLGGVLLLLGLIPAVGWLRRHFANPS